MRLALVLKAVEAEEEGLVAAVMAVDMAMDMGVVQEEMIEEVTGEVAEGREVEGNDPDEWGSDII